jgi:stage II sporulation protein D
VSRNYALQRVRETRNASFDVTGDQYSQVYSGYNGETGATNRAVDDTAGVVMLNRGILIPSFFHSSSGGFTENTEDVWLTIVPSVRTKKDPYDQNDSHYNWQVNYTADQLIELLKNEGEFRTIRDISFVTTTSGARMQEMTVTGVDAQGNTLRVKVSNADRVRMTLGLKSALFTMDKSYNKDENISGVRITGSGFGHGLGMPQYGARGMAQQGLTYRDILQFYFTDITIVNNYGR